MINPSTYKITPHFMSVNPLIPNKLSQKKKSDPPLETGTFANSGRSVCNPGLSPGSPALIPIPPIAELPILVGASCSRGTGSDETIMVYPPLGNDDIST